MADEYISRKAAIKAVTENDYEGYATWAIKAVPAADVIPVRHGRWLKKHDDLRWWKECSECGLQSFTTPPGLTNFRYCPWCGTRMDNGFGGE